MATFGKLEETEEGYKISANLEALIKEKKGYIYIKFLGIWFCCDSGYGEWALADEWDSNDFKNNEDECLALATNLGYNIHDFQRIVKSHLNVLLFIYNSKKLKKIRKTKTKQEQKNESSNKQKAN